MPAAIKRLPDCLDAPSAPAPATVGPATPRTANAENPQARRGPFRPRTLVSAPDPGAAPLALDFVRLADGVTLAGAALFAVIVGLGGAPLRLSVGQALPFVAAPLVCAWMLDQLGLYRSRRGDDWAGRVRRMIPALGAGLAVAAAFALAVGAGAAALPALLTFAGTALLVLAALHGIVSIELRRWRESGRLTPNIVIVGATVHTGRLIRLALARREVNILGVFDDRLARSPRDLQGVPVLGDVDALLGHRILPSIDRVVIALDPAARTRAREIALRLSVLPNEVSLLVDVDTDKGCEAALRRLADSAFTPMAGLPDDTRRVFAKRLQDLVIATIALVGLSPLMALAALAVKLDSPGPVFFRQRRHGFNNEAIVVWKFRSMRQDAADATAARQVTADDDRVTRVGRFLRRTSLDELPQLFNVLTGEMSLVGPRPHAIGMKTGETDSARLVAEYAWRHRMKPGLTGWAAIHGSRGPLHTAEEVRRRVSLDIEYVERQSFWLDLRIMLMTVPCLLGDAGTVR